TAFSFSVVSLPDLRSAFGIHRFHLSDASLRPGSVGSDQLLGRSASGFFTTSRCPESNNRRKSMLLRQLDIEEQEPLLKVDPHQEQVLPRVPELHLEQAPLKPLERLQVPDRHLQQELLERLQVPDRHLEQEPLLRLEHCRYRIDTCSRSY
uniref:Zgc: n=1 Tax=Macrostomum lignano TaxID=282301 RepID=A0A1I8GAR7_9PLAT